MDFFVVDVLVENPRVLEEVFFVRKCKELENRSKTDLNSIEKTNNKVVCNYSQAKYNILKYKTTDLLQAMTRTCKVLHSIEVD